jgi:hypothetical protein
MIPKSGHRFSEEIMLDAVVLASMMRPLSA